jgi:pilus assembly protein Flp/PilA
MDTLNWLLALVWHGVRKILWWPSKRVLYLSRLATQGQGLVEYALILVLVALVVIGILTTLGGRTSQVFDQVNCTLGGGEYRQDNGNGNSNRCR